MPKHRIQSAAPENASQPKQGLSFFEVLAFAAGYWREQGGKLAVILFLFVAAALLETYLPTALSNFLQAIRVGAGKSPVLHALAVFLGVYFLQMVLFGVSFVIYNIFETAIFKSLMDDAFAHVQTLSEHFFVNTFTGAIVSKISRARQKIESFEDQILIRVIPTIVVLAGSTAFLAMRFPVLALLMILYVVLLFGVSAYFVFRISGPAQGIYAAAQDSFIAHLADSIGGMSTTKAYAQEQIEFTNFLDVTEQLRAKNEHSYKLGSYAAIVQRLLLTGMLVLLLGGGVWYLFNGRANVEAMAYLAFAYTILQSYVRDLVDNIKNILTSSYDLHAVISLLREEPEVPATAMRPALDIRRGQIAFEQVRFTYPGKSAPVFADLSVSIGGGERVALVGHSGSGKTTFVRLLQCLYVIQQGHIRIDGQDIAQGSRASLRSAIALVPQDPILFHRTLAENIGYGKPEADLQSIHRAAEQAHIASFIMGLPQQYDTLVGERGSSSPAASASASQSRAPSWLTDRS